MDSPRMASYRALSYMFNANDPVRYSDKASSLHSRMQDVWSKMTEQEQQLLLTEPNPKEPT